MRLMRLRAVNEVRRTADSQQGKSGGQVCPEPEALPEQRRMGWVETECLEVRVGEPRIPDPVLKERVRSQSPHSSCEAGNDRGAKEDRKVET